MISREQAAEIAKVDAMAHGLGNVVSSVETLDEIVSRKPVPFDVSLDGCWIAYIKNPLLAELCSSIIVVVDRNSGIVVYRGSANDEG